MRTKLVAALLSLVIVALAVIDFVSISQLQNYLIGQANQQLQTAAGNFTDGGLRISNSSAPPIGSATVVQLYDQSGQWIKNLGSGMESLDYPVVQLPVTASWLTANANTALSANSGQYENVTLPSGRQWRVFVLTVHYLTPSGWQTAYLVSASDLSEVYKTVRQLTGLDIIVSAGIVVVLAAVGFAVVRANLRSLVDIEETAGEIAQGHLNRRVPERDPRTEIGRLGRSLNTMLSQIETAFHAREESEAAAHKSEERMRRFIADASHELRTPLTAIRGFAEYYRQRGGLVQQWDEDEQAQAVSGLSGEDLDRIMHRVEAEAARMGLLVEDLLLLARMDQQRPLTRTPVDLLSLAADAVHDTRMLAPDRTIELKVQPGAAFLVIGDEARLRQVIGNLMSNALTHTPEGTEVDVSISSGILDPRASARQPAVILDVADHGPGMTEDQAQRVFERFYRADQARTRTKGGSGLGLAIVAALVAAHGGLASVRTAPGQGATFRVALPLAPEAQGSDDGTNSEVSDAVDVLEAPDAGEVAGANGNAGGDAGVTSGTDVAGGADVVDFGKQAG